MTALPGPAFVVLTKPGLSGPAFAAACRTLHQCLPLALTGSSVLAFCALTSGLTRDLIASCAAQNTQTGTRERVQHIALMLIVPAWRWCVHVLRAVANVASHLRALRLSFLSRSPCS